MDEFCIDKGLLTRVFRKMCQNLRSGADCLHGPPCPLVTWKATWRLDQKEEGQGEWGEKQPAVKP